MKRLLEDEIVALIPASLHHCEPRCDVAGAWKLAAGHAVTLQPRTGGLFHVVRGAFWATFDGPHAVAARNSGDHFLSTGDSLRLRAGERLVIEPWHRDQCAWFGWEADLGAERQLLQAVRRLFRL